MGLNKSSASAPTANVVSVEDGMEVKVWGGSDGKYGVTIGTSTSPRSGETADHAMQRIVQFAIAKLRETMQAMEKVEW